MQMLRILKLVLAVGAIAIGVAVLWGGHPFGLSPVDAAALAAGMAGGASLI